MADRKETSVRTNDKRPAVRPLATLLIALLLAIGAFTATAGTSTGTEELVVEVTPEFAENVVGSDHTVTVTVTYDGLPTTGITVDFFVLAGPNVGLFLSGFTDPVGQISFEYTGSGGVGTDEIQVCATSQAGDQTCRTDIFKDWVPLPNTPPAASCVETVNPSGAKTPPAGSTTLPGPLGGQNEDGFYELVGVDNEDGTAVVFVTNASGSATFGPFASGSVVKITEAERTPTARPMGGPNSAVAAHITLDSDAFVFAVDSFGEVSAVVLCLVPEPPK